MTEPNPTYSTGPAPFAWYKFTTTDQLPRDWFIAVLSPFPGWSAVRWNGNELTTVSRNTVPVEWIAWFMVIEPPE